MNIDNYYLHDINFCPKCAYEYVESDFTMPEALFDCKNCGFKFFHQAKYGVAPIIPQLQDPSKLLIGTRNIEPNKGKLDLPGGFLNFAEDPAAALAREVKEELGIVVTADKLLMTNGQEYEMNGRIWYVMNLYYVTTPVSKEQILNLNDEVEKAEFYDLDYLISDASPMAFAAEKEALKYYAKFI